MKSALLPIPRQPQATSDCATAPLIMGGEDFAYMLEERPGAYILVGNGDTAAVHHPEYNFNDAAIPAGCSWWAEIVETFCLCFRQSSLGNQLMEQVDSFIALHETKSSDASEGHKESFRKRVAENEAALESCLSKCLV